MLQNKNDIKNVIVIDDMEFNLYDIYESDAKIRNNPKKDYI
jgi:hypothetical protein